MLYSIVQKLCTVTLPFLLVLLLSPAVFAQQMNLEEGIDFFESKIRPVLVRECYGCHSKQSGQQKGGLTVDTKQGMLLGGTSGPTLVPGDLDESPLWAAINYEDYAMPPNKQLPADVVEDFRVWIESGAPDPRGTEAVKADIQSTVSKEDIERGRDEFWAFQLPHKVAPSSSPNDQWAATPIDKYVASKLDENSLVPAPDADAATLLRRLSYDLTGLPPTAEQLSSFLDSWKNDADKAFGSAVDRLLASPQFGERWGRHWLDVVRYAESSGKEVNATFPNAWRYRDYVIDSFNADKPYDRFVQEQLAGDLLPVKTDEQWSKNLIATGFLAMGPKTLTERNPRQFRADLIDEQIDVSTRVVMGVSVACARCHDHKFDPIPQEDYYAMAGIFASTETYYGTIDTRQNRQPSDLILLPKADETHFEKPLKPEQLTLIATEIKSLQEQIRELNKVRRQDAKDPESAKKAQLAQRQRNQLGGRVSTLQSVADAYNKDGTPKTFCMGVQPVDKPMNVNLLVRGEVDQPADVIPRGFVQVIGGKPLKIKDRSSGRLELAKWMTDESNPLTSRVMVNRLWQHLMGQGIVETPENFGATGMPPTHPELLDYLAIQFMEQGWSVKTMIREIVSSRTYRMSATHNDIAYEKDPGNKWLWRHSPKRLEAESLRDSMLQLAGTLKLDRPPGSDVARAGTTVVRGGRMISARATLERAIQQKERQAMSGDDKMMNSDDKKPALSRDERRKQQLERRKRAEEMRKIAANAPKSDPDHTYRSIYLPIVRDSAPRALAVFDFAESTMVVGKRESSNTPDQGLYFLNNTRVLKASQQFAARVMKQPGTMKDKVSHAFVMAYSRPPTEEELAASLQFLKDFEPGPAISKPSGDAPRNANRDSKRRGRRNADRKSNQSSQSEKAPQQLSNMTYLCQALMASAEFRILN